MATFPLAQAPQLSNYKESTIPRVVRTETEGPIKQAVLYSTHYTNYSVAYFFTDAELAIWRTFFKTTISDGALSFDWVNPLSGKTVDARMIGGAWELSATSPNVNLISFALEVFDA